MYVYSQSYGFLFTNFLIVLWNYSPSLVWVGVIQCHEKLQLFNYDEINLHM